ncbi:hypothetical protein D3C71_821630 [compost metagenome]
MQQLPDPVTETGQRRQVQAQLRAVGGHGFRGGGLAEHGLGDVARKQADGEKDNHRYGEQ